MPSVSVLPTPTPSSPAFPSSSGNSGGTNGKSVSSIKTAAKSSVQSILRHSSQSAAALVKTATSQSHEARSLELAGDFRAALTCLTKAGLLMQRAMDSSELNGIDGKALRKEVKDFFDREDITLRIRRVEEMVRELETGEKPKGHHPTPSIKDRIKALADNGLELANGKLSSPSPTSTSFPTSKEMPASSSRPSSKDPTPTPTPSISGTTTPTPSHTASPSISHSLSSAPSLSQLHSQLASSSNGIGGGFVPMSTFGPPSPTSSASGSSTSLPSSPTITASAPATNEKESARWNITESQFNKAFPSLDEFEATSHLGLPSSSTSTTPTINGHSSTTPTSVSPPLPPASVGTISPVSLLSQMASAKNILLLDLRSREEWEKERIECHASVCISHGSKSIPINTLASSLPANEGALLNNRDKFDLVVFYAASSSIAPDSPLQHLASSLAEAKELKQPPLILEGGLQGWKGAGGRTSGNESNRASGVNGHTKNSPNYSLSLDRSSHRRIPADSSPPPSGPASPGLPSQNNPVSISYPIIPPSSSSSTNGRPITPPGSTSGLSRRPAIVRASVSTGPAPGHTAGYGQVSAPQQPPLPHSVTPRHAPSQSVPPAQITTPITYPAVPSRSSNPMPNGSTPSNTSLHLASNSVSFNTGAKDPTSPITSPPVASINPTLTRRRSDYVDSFTPFSAGAFGQSAYPSPPQSLPVSPGSGGHGKRLFGLNGSANGSPVPLSGGIDYPDLSKTLASSASTSPPSPYNDSTNGANLIPNGASSGYGAPPQLNLNGYSSLGGLGVGGAVLRPPPAAASIGDRVDSRNPYSPPPLPPAPPSPYGHNYSGSAPSLVNGGKPVNGALQPPRPPRIASDYPPTYSAWLVSPSSLPSNARSSTKDKNTYPLGLKNMGNTCYMNAPIQCLVGTIPFSLFFLEMRPADSGSGKTAKWKHAINYTNPLGSGGKLVTAFARLVGEMWGAVPSSDKGGFFGSSGDGYLTPVEFRKMIAALSAQFSGTEQHDSQEFLSFLLDGIHEDLNRVMGVPTKEQPKRPDPKSKHLSPAEQRQLALEALKAEKEEEYFESLPLLKQSSIEWSKWKERNDSLIVDFFQGQFRSRLECLNCRRTSTTYNVFSILQLPIPSPTSSSSRVPLHSCLSALLTTETLQDSDAWDCPRCKSKQRARKSLSLARLPPVLCIHLKRFEFESSGGGYMGQRSYSDKIDTFVEFPPGLDLSDWMPSSEPGAGDDDPQTQSAPYRYELYGVTNHVGNLSSGHYTAFVNHSRNGWLYCDDSVVKPVDSRSVVSQRAYVLFYRRVRA